MLIDTGLASVYLNADVAKGLERARHAAAIARSMDASGEDGIEALLILSEQARTSGHLEEARQALVDAARWVDQQGTTGMLPNVLSPLGEVQDALGQLEAASATLSRAITLAEHLGDPMTLHIARAKLAFFQYEHRLLHDALDSAGAEAVWARGLGRDSEFGELPAVVLINYGRVLVAYGDAERGMAALDEARAVLPPSATNRLSPLLSARADALVSLGRLDEAGADVERALALVTRAGGDRYIEAVRVVRRRYLVAAGRAQDALQDFAAHPQKAGETDTAVVKLRRQAEEAALLLAAGRDADARTVATNGLAALERLPERRFEGDAEARLTAVLGAALLREGRASEALPVLDKALALHVAQYDPARSPATAKVRLLLAEARRGAAR
jgi:eukaryotic-like serine/threonine-protein kinase